MQRLEFKATVTAGLEGRIEGLASVFGALDRGGDVVHKGAFASAQAPIPMLDSHHPDAPIGVWEEVTETADGLSVKGRLLVQEVPRAAEVLALIEAGAMRGLSIGYIARKAARRANGVRDLTAVELVEISVVAVPMCPGADISAVKSAEGETMTKEELANMLAELGITAEQKAFDPAKAMADAVAAAVAPVAAKLEEVETKLNRPGGMGGAPAKDPSAEFKAFSAYLVRGPLTPETELKVLSVASDPNGGYLASPEFSSEVLRDLVEMSPMRSIASIRGTNAPSVIYPTRKPMGNATWDDDTTPEPETTATNIFGQIEIFPKGISTFVDIPNTLLQDAPAVETEVRAALAEDFAKKESVAFVNGDGIAAPEGLMTNAEIATFNNGATTLTTPDGLIKFLYSFAPSYRNRGVWAMNGTTLGVLRTMKGTDGQMIWQRSLAEGQPETILGRPVVEMIDMPDIAVNGTPILYGDFSGYRILDRLALSMLVDPYSQATLKRTRYHAGRRVGGRVIQAAKFKKLKMAV